MCGITTPQGGENSLGDEAKSRKKFGFFGFSPIDAGEKPDAAGAGQPFGGISRALGGSSRLNFPLRIRFWKEKGINLVL